MAYNSGKRNVNKGDKKPFKKSNSKFSNDKSFSSDKKKSYERKDNRSEKSFKPEKSFKKRTDSFNYNETEKKQFSSKNDTYSDKSFKKPYKKKDENKSDFDFKKPYQKSSNFKKNFKEENRNYFKEKTNKFSETDREAKKPYKKPFVKGINTGEENQSSREAYKAKRSFSKNKDFRAKQTNFEKPLFSKDKQHTRPFERKYKDKNKTYNDKKINISRDENYTQKRVGYEEFGETKSFNKERFDKKNLKKENNKPNKKSKDSSELIRLNKYLSNAGIASRRDADILIKSGVVKVNGIPVTEMGYKIKASDNVTYGDAKVKSERKVYLLLNKPKDYITTMEDTHDRKTVMDLISNACSERIYPVGRLDRNTTGVLLFTNDGELAKKLTHPKNDIKKIYHVSLSKALKTDDFNQIQDGIELEDGFIQVDDIAFVGEGKKEIGIEIHSGRNRIVRRIFEHLGYEILKLDRVTFAGLTKKDLPRSKHRFLTQKEVAFLKMI